MGRSFDSLQRSWDNRYFPDDEREEVWCHDHNGWWMARNEDEECPVCASCAECGKRIDEFGSGTCDECSVRICSDCGEPVTVMPALVCAMCIKESE